MLLKDTVRNSDAVEVLDHSIESDKQDNPFLHGVPAILHALNHRADRIPDFRPEQSFTRRRISPMQNSRLSALRHWLVRATSHGLGLTENIELNIQVQSAREVGPASGVVRSTLERSQGNNGMRLSRLSSVTRAFYTPFDVYTKALQEFFRGHELTATEWDETRSKMFPRLDRYQKEAYWALMKIARQHGGAFLCDGVGLGKTFVGLMLIERLVLHEGKRVVLFAPKRCERGRLGTPPSGMVASHWRRRRRR